MARTNRYKNNDVMNRIEKKINMIKSRIQDLEYTGNIEGVELRMKYESNLRKLEKSLEDMNNKTGGSATKTPKPVKMYFCDKCGNPTANNRCCGTDLE